MTPKKKDAASSSETSSSNSSSSTTSSSSSTESDSSSSDSENTSTSGAKSGHASSDSDKKPIPKKKTPASSTKSKTADTTSETPDKGKEKPNKTKVSSSGQKQVYSSESDDSPKPNLKRKPPAKPKASATVTPLAKAAKAGGGSNKTTSGGTAPPPAKKAAVISSVKRTSQRSNPKEPPSKPYGPVPKLEEQKKLKTKSIFSPDNSTDTDDDDTSTPPPPKLTAMKTAATKVLKAKPRTKSIQSDKSRASSVSSNSSVSSRSSGSSSESSGGRSPREKGTRRNSGGGSENRTKGSRRSSSSGGGGGGSQQQAKRKDKKWSGGSSSGNAGGPPQLVSDSDTTARKQTRSANTRRSKHIAAPTTAPPSNAGSRVVSESDSDTVGSKTSASKSPVKKAGPKGPAARKIKGQNSNEASHLIEFEERRCPLEACDSLGHLGGKADKHFTIEACPMYHRLTSNDCKEALAERRKREEERKDAAFTLKPSHLTSPTPEQKLYREKVKEMRSKPILKEEGNNDSDSGKDRQPDLSRCCNKYDLKLFQEAQAVSSEMIEEDLKLLANVRGTKYIEMGKFEMEVWYQSPYPEDYARLPKLYICEFCLRYMKSRYTLERHAAKCVWRHPPGEEVYRKEKISVWEVDGKRYKLYCQNLCLLAKFFLDHKTLYYDVEPFLFYVMTISDNEGCHTVGYFSKEKNSFLNYNVSCILTLPPYQRQGYGRLLIDFSYLLTRVENKVGSPEKPLSDLGLISYRSYWKDVLLEYLCKLSGKQLSIKDMSQEMAINAYDIVSTLQALGMMKYWKGKHIVLKKQDVIEEHRERSKRRGLVYKEIDPECLKWTPFVPATPPTGPS